MEKLKRVPQKSIASKSKTLLVLYTGGGVDPESLTLSPGVQRTFEIWRDILKPKGYELGRASIHWFKGRHFDHYWRIDSAGNWEKINHKISPEFIDDKTRSYDLKTGQPIAEILNLRKEISSKIRMINTFEFTNLIANKLNQAVIFSRFMPTTHLLLPGSQVRNPDKENVVLKRLYGSGGKQVKISDAKTISIKELLVRQNFVRATKNGRLRDVRVGFVGEEPQYAYYRIAKKGDLFTNVHQGATMEFEDLGKIKSLVEFSQRVAHPLKVFPKKVFSLDYLIDAESDEPFLIEANSMPGFKNFPDSVLEKFFTSLTKLFLAN